MRSYLVAVMVGVAACTNGSAATTSSTIPGEPATVVAVSDGDTLRVLLSGTEVEIRLEGINAPEHGECFDDEARDMLAGVVGNQVIVGESSPGRDQYGRIVAYVHVGELNINRWLLQEGAVMATSGEHELLAEFLADDEEAYGRGVGMWARGVCRPDPDPEVFLYAVEPDAPGRDEANPNGEFVVIGNRGSAVDLTGWVVRDESSVHRYRFPSGTTLGGGSLLSVRSGCGSSTAGEVHWCADGAVWNNDGDTALLLDAAGRVVDRWRYRSER